MGMSATARLRYGVILGGDEGEWRLEEYSKDTYSLTGTAAWITTDDEDNDWQSQAEERLLGSVGFMETDWRTSGYHDRKREAEKLLNVELEHFGSYEYTVYALVIKEFDLHVNWGVEQITLPPLVPGTASAGMYDTALRQASKVLGITPLDKPGWLLGAFYG